MLLIPLIGIFILYVTTSAYCRPWLYLTILLDIYEFLSVIRSPLLSLSPTDHYRFGQALANIDTDVTGGGGVGIGSIITSGGTTPPSLYIKHISGTLG